MSIAKETVLDELYTRLAEQIGLTEDQLAAITVAVLSHRDTQRHQAAPEQRAHQPGSQLYASRWVSVGRAQQTQPWRRK